MEGATLLLYLPPDVLENSHYTNEYAPGASGYHRILRLSVTGLFRPSFPPQNDLGRRGVCPVRGVAYPTALWGADLKALARCR